MSIGENIKKIREQHGLSQEEFGKIFGVTNKAVSFWESDTKVPRMGIIQKMADYFGIKKSNIIEEDGLSDNFLEKKKEDEEIEAIIQGLKDRPEMKTLFMMTTKTKKEDVEKVIKMMEIFKDTNPDL